MSGDAPSLPPRVAVIQRELDRFERVRYLEVGVFDGTVFTNVRAHAKVAVDPKIRLSRRRRAREAKRAGATFHEVPSDEYFARLEASVTFDVVFVDGLHLYEQALRDVENALTHLSEDGVVLMHDCNPPAEAVAARDPRVTTAAGYKAWCGDVWKAVVHLRACRPDLDVSVLDADYGIGVVRPRTARETLGLSSAEVESLGYSDLEADREGLLGLAPFG